MPERTNCCIVGGGPGGAILALLLSRLGIATVLLEAKHDFDRAFRGDTVHPSTLEMLDDLGLAAPLLAREHGRLQRVTLRSGSTSTVLADFSRLRTRFPFIAMIPQAEFLEFIMSEANTQGGFDLRLGSRVTDLIVGDEDDPNEDATHEGTRRGTVRGVRYRDADGEHELLATLTVAADGRASRLRALAGFEPKPNAAAMDVMWVVLPRRDDELGIDLTGFRIGLGRLVVVLARATEWQLGYVILKGSQHTVKNAGLPVLRAEVASLIPELADRVHAIEDWTDVHFLSVESSRVPTWHRPGLLALGDAAHVMSPIGGVGINYAIQDAVAAANYLAEPLLAGTLSDADLAAVQRRREFPTRFIQGFQAIVQRLVVARALEERPFRLPLPARLVSRLPWLRDVPARVVGWGIRPERVVQKHLTL